MVTRWKGFDIASHLISLYLFIREMNPRLHPKDGPRNGKIFLAWDWIGVRMQ